MIPDGLKYTKSHEWVEIEGDTARIGITDYAQSQLGDITYVELPAEGKEVSPGESVAVVESVKAASDIYAPLSGTVSEVNSELENAPENVNSDPYKSGWIMKLSGIQASDADGLMDAKEYEKLLADGSA